MTRTMTAPPESQRVWRLADLAELVGGRVDGDADARVQRVAAIDHAGPDDLGLLTDARFAAKVASTRAAALLVSEDLADAAAQHRARLVVDDARQAMVAVLNALYPLRVDRPGVHPTAVLGENVEVAPDCSVGPYAVVEDGARIGARSVLRAHVVIGRGAVVGEDCCLHPHVVLYDGARIGDRVTLHAGARVGVDGFGYVPGPSMPIKVPHVGTCVIEDDVEVGANACMDRGSIGHTTIECGTKLDNLVHVAHNVTVGAGSLMAALVGIAGSTKIGRGTMWGGQSGAVNHLTIGDGVRVAAQTGVTSNQPPGVVLSGFPGRPSDQFNRAMAALYRLPKLRHKIRDIDRRMAAISGGPPDAVIE